MTYYVYMLCCADNTFYTGITTDIDRRIAEHNNSDRVGARYTRVRRPVQLIYQTSHANRGDALREEARIKKMTRKQKEAFVADKDVSRNIDK
ncbi:MAG: GIY-YIG nuclease family protein [Candidatus Pacebacteria bacterium]|nr:GIY-YIG nuclease family protein [Candidatus Paceibacterota bacterium]